jgi:hypothetical protein
MKLAYRLLAFGRDFKAFLMREIKWWGRIESDEW